ncbi:MAG: pentapeptide repeat-containing protein [Chloroflexota bacterium]
MGSANLERADLRGADLTSATLHRARLQGIWRTPPYPWQRGHSPLCTPTKQIPEQSLKGVYRSATRATQSPS